MRPFRFCIILIVHCLSVPVWSRLPDEFEYSYNEWRFREQVERALQVVEGILNTTRHPTLPGLSDNHTYEDKYALVETMTNTAIASYITVLEHLGIRSITEIVSWVQEERRPVVLLFEMNPMCVFDRRSERQVVTSEVEIERSQGGSGLMGRLTNERENVKVKRTVVEYFWNVTAAYKLVLASGDDEIELLQRDETNAATTIKITGGSQDEDNIPEAPCKNYERAHHEVSMTWLFENIRMFEAKSERNGGTIVSKFAIDRLAPTCKTPARNDDVEKAWAFADGLVEWTTAVSDRFKYLNVIITHAASWDSWPTTVHNDRLRKEIFSPILPLFEDSKVLPQADVENFLQAHNTSLTEYIDQTTESFPESGLMSRHEVKIVTLLDHLSLYGCGLVRDWQYSVGLVEKLLVDQLVKAIGKEIKASDFEEFMSFHSKGLLLPMYAPRSFSYSVRNGTSSFPDGLFSIEATSLNRKSLPIETTVRHVAGGADHAPFSIPVTAATSVEIGGSRSLHGWLRYQWQDDTSDLNLHARAHQFSSFVVLIGKMNGPDKFMPKDAIIVQNKDEVLVPLLANVLPSAKEFKDAVSSLSPEQRAFAEAFRAMQLQSSVFGVCIIQIKPQLERLLNLPAKSLAKEIQLTQDLMSLFVEYQIPSDLLSFDGDNDAPTTEKVQAVRGYVKAVTDVIDGAKKKQLEEESQKAKMKEHKHGKEYAARPTVGPTAGPTAAGRAVRSSSSASSRVLQATMAMAGGDEFMAFSGSESQGMDETHTTSAGHMPPAKSSSSRQESTKDWRGDKDTPSSLEDFTKIPVILDKKLEALDPDGALKSTILETGSTWSRSRQENLLEAPKKNDLYPDDIRKETNKAMDLLTALSRSGSLPINSSELHIVVTVTHCFEKSVIDTVIKDNVNPIEKVEKSLLVLASTIQLVEKSQLISSEEQRG